jgi:hypothetical protein
VHKWSADGVIKLNPVYSHSTYVTICITFRVSPKQSNTRSGYSFTELADVHWKCYRGCCKSQINYPSVRELPDDRRLLETGTFPRMQWDFGHPRSMRRVQMEEQTLRSLKDSVRNLTSYMGTSHAYVRHISKEQPLYPCYT